MIKLSELITETTLAEAQLREENEVTIKIGPETVYWGILEKVLRLLRYHLGQGKQARFIVMPEVRAALGTALSKRLDDELHKFISKHAR